MYSIQKLNKISPRGLALLENDKYEVASEIMNPHGILVRSQKMHDMELPDTIKAIARAGAGVNNIPVDRCSEKGIVVFNTPGANANGVKELVLTALFLSCRDIIQGMEWLKGLSDKGDEIPKLVENGKSQFKGPEIKGKKLGVVGLGAIGVMVANAASSLGMEVTGYDPYISVEAAWGLSRNVSRAISIDSLLSDVDFITLHVPLNDKTRGMFNKDRFDVMKGGARIINFARGGLVNNEDLKIAIEEEKVSRYVTDFPDSNLVNMKNVIAFPHLGASTFESEDNCAVMAAKQLKDYLENGNIKNSVNFPECAMAMSGTVRITIANRNVPNMVGQIASILADEKINIENMINKHRDEIAYNIIDINETPDEKVIKKLEAIEGVIMVRVIDGKK